MLGLRVRCTWREFPDDDLMYVILFVKNVKLGKNVQRFISLSILQNSIETLCLDALPDIDPMSSLTKVQCHQKVTYKNGPLQSTMTIVLRDIVRLVASTPAEGIVFETFFVKWLRYRWAVARQARKKISLMELLGITASDVTELKYSLDMIATSHVPYIVNLMVNSNENFAAHLEEVGKIIESAKKPIAALIGAKDETLIGSASLYISRRRSVPTAILYRY